MGLRRLAECFTKFMSLCNIFPLYKVLQKKDFTEVNLQKNFLQYLCNGRYKINPREISHLQKYDGVKYRTIVCCSAQCDNLQNICWTKSISKLNVEKWLKTS